MIDSLVEDSKATKKSKHYIWSCLRFWREGAPKSTKNSIRKFNNYYVSHIPCQHSDASFVPKKEFYYWTITLANFGSVSEIVS